MVEAPTGTCPAPPGGKWPRRLGLRDGLWELGCFPDGVAKTRIRFTPVFFRWEAPEPRFDMGRRSRRVLRLPLAPLLDAPWTTQHLDLQGLALDFPGWNCPGPPLGRHGLRAEGLAGRAASVRIA